MPSVKPAFVTAITEYRTTEREIAMALGIDLPEHSTVRLTTHADGGGRATIVVRQDLDCAKENV